MSKERPCEHCDSPDISLLRIVLIGEIIRADELTLYTLVELCATLGLLELVEPEEEQRPKPPTKQPKNFLHRIK